MSLIAILPITFTDANFLSSNILENDYAAYNPLTNYALGDWVMVVGVDVHKIYQSLANGNLGNNPLTSPTFWNDGGSTNRYRMFDATVTSQSSSADIIQAQVYIPEIIDSVSFRNINAQSVRVVMTDLLDGVVYDETVNLVSDAGIDDYFEYWFNPVRRVSNYTFTDLPLYSNTTLDVYIEDDGGVAMCGACFFGLSEVIGLTQYGLTLGRTSFSNVTTNDFGNTSITRRGNVRNVGLSAEVNNESLGFVDQRLSELLDVPAIYIGSVVFNDATSVYGIYQEYEVLVNYALTSILSIKFKGLI